MDNTLNNISNKFTGKERDQETGYDYFGARYYDSRIGKWLQTEPLYDKYFQYSPYCYGILNPMKLIDFDGNDVIVTIEGTTITFTINIYYVSSENELFKKPGINTSYALNNEQIEFYTQNIKDAKKDWSRVNEIEYGGNKYSVKFDFNFIEAKTISEISENLNTIRENIAIPSVDEEGNPRVQNGNILIFPLVDLSEYPPHDPAHEFGHLMGLTHNYKNIFTGKNDRDIMGYSEKRNYPEKINVIRILNKIEGPLKSIQTIAGAKENYVNEK